ncbi:ABC transporter substrate-binding protein [Paenibacillus hexagrammi]|uniref:ABC transporter substrate-binding protein n=1 Tax=Paenibacillus hexagrammi TaxID=2908839 RepID=A0ABY3SJB9_9BACL|nr:ABC transporter substrate-binding protein [Paenibacillus sp. YPD9-1]UJF34046.1 ABC transporter substrate-binding protein [Paenibacillus sp. YPD9-1]
MKIRRHYLALRNAFPDISEDTPLDITVQELADLLTCTHRNMVLLLKRMQQEGWLVWTPKKGRSNRSTLIFTASRERVILEEAQEMVDKQNLRSALDLLHTENSSTGIRGQFQDWLSEQFGFHSEIQGQRRMDILRFPLPQTIHSLDPAAIHFTGESHLVNQLFDGLVRIDYKGQSVLPHLAHAWEADAARTTWTFYLRKGVRFHHGRDMHSGDVKYSLERLQRMAQRGLYSWAYAGIEAIETPDDTTVRIHLAKRNEAFLPFLATNRASIVPQDFCEAAGGDFGLSPVGTGPFRLAGKEQGIWVLEAFPSYFQGRGFLDRVEVWSLPEGEQHDASAPLPAFQVMHNARMPDMEENWRQVRQSGMTCKFITVNEEKEGPLTNEVLRAAVDEALDRIYLLELLSGDVIEGGDSFWPQLEETAARPLPKCVNDVKQQLVNSGYRGETLILATIPQYEFDARAVQEVCRRAGIQLDIRLLPAEEFKGETRMSADLLLFAVMLDEHRELRLIDLFKSMQEHAMPDVKNWMDDKLEHILTESNASERARHFVEMETMLKHRHSLLFLYRKHLKTAFHPSIRGISLESLGWVRFRDLWFIPSGTDSE